MPYKTYAWFRLLKGIVGLFVRKPKVINFNDTMMDKAIFVSNHDAVKGPLVLSLYFPFRFVPWGTYEMTERYSVRYHYLYEELYRKKLGLPVVIAWILSLLFATVSKILYHGIHLIPTYPDQRLIRTFRKSKDVLDHGLNLLIFPENSNNGYQSVMTEYFPGFIAFSQYYFKHTGEDRPIYPIYYNRKKQVIVIDKPVYIQSLRKTHPTKASLSDYFVRRTNALYGYVDQRFSKEKKHENSHLST